MCAPDTPGQSNKSSIRLWSVVLWLLLWHGLSLYIGQEILLVSPVTVVFRLFQLALEPSYWLSLWFSFQRIAAGFVLGTVFGVVLAGAAARFRRLEEFLAPAILLLKATPVASFIILVLIWISARNLSILISFLMVLPIVYTNVLRGIHSADRNLLEMADVFRVPAWRRIRFIYVSQVAPFFQSACLVGLGLCWKAGIAAEVIGIPNGSIGQKLYMAKIYLVTPDLLAWTLTIIIISIAFERLFMRCIERVIRRLEGM